MENKQDLVASLEHIKEENGKTCSQIAAETGLTNVYVAQLFRRQAQLKPETVDCLRKAVPGLQDDHIKSMMRPPLRSYDPNLVRDPCIYRLNEAVMHFGESIKEVINEDFGDGITMEQGIEVCGEGKMGHAISQVGQNADHLICLLLLTNRMSAIDFYCSVDKVKGIDGKDRVVLTFDGKYLPHVEQKSELCAARLLKR